MSKEKRKHRRFNISQIIELDFMKEKYFEANGLNISEGGILCSSTYPVEPLARVFLMINIPLPDKEFTLKTEGIVMHSKKERNKYIFGISFTDLAQEEKKILKSLCEES